MGQKNDYSNALLYFWWQDSIHQGTVDNNLGPDRFAGPKAVNPNYADNQACDCTHFVWKSQLCMVLSYVCLGPRHSPGLILLMSRIWQQLIQILTSLAMTRFGPSIEPTTFPTQSRYATCYVMPRTQVPSNIINKIIFSLKSYWWKSCTNQLR